MTLTVWLASPVTCQSVTVHDWVHPRFRLASLGSWQRDKAGVTDSDRAEIPSVHYRQGAASPCVTQSDSLESRVWGGLMQIFERTGARCQLYLCVTHTFKWQKQLSTLKYTLTHICRLSVRSYTLHVSSQLSGFKWENNPFFFLHFAGYVEGCCMLMGLCIWLYVIVKPTLKTSLYKYCLIRFKGNRVWPHEKRKHFPPSGCKLPCFYYFFHCPLLHTQKTHQHYRAVAFAVFGVKWSAI